MKFTCGQQSLSRALNTVSKAVTSRTTIPILKGILINAKKEGDLILSASDLDISIEKTMKGISVEEEGSAVVSAKLFTDIVRKLPNEDIIIEKKEENNISIRTSMSEFTIVGFSPEEFPAIGEIEEEERITLNKEIFKDMIRKTAFSASIDESKGLIIGVLIEVEENFMNMVALDGFRMAVVREEMSDGRKNKIVVSARIMNDINKILADIEDDEDIVLSLEKKKAVLLSENIKIVMRLLDGEFIKYKDILPKEHNCRLKVSKAALHEGIERAALLSKEGKNNLIKFKIEENMMIITSRSEEGNVREEVPVEKDGNDIEIGFNSKYILDVLKVLEDEEIAMEMVSSVKPCVIKPVEGGKFEYLVLPVRIS